jgi:excisionase family DNA binding protein
LEKVHATVFSVIVSVIVSVSAEELQSVRPAGIGGQKRCFEPTEVDSYLRRFRENTGLVPLELALVELGAVRLSDLHRRWIARKMLTPIDSGLGLYFASTEVEASKSEASRWLTTKEAAAVLSVTQHQLRNWVKLGRISPVSGPQIDGGRVFLFDKAEVEKLLEVANAG